MTGAMVEVNADSDNGWNRLLLVVGALTPVVLRVRAMAASSVAGLPAWRRHPGIEIVADILFIAAILPRVTVWRRGETGSTAEAYIGMEASIDFPWPEISLPLAEIYEAVAFEPAVIEPGAE
jgi:hypothetical protein